jgi:hypothetical protein
MNEAVKQTTVTELSAISFNAKWVAKIITAVTIGGIAQYVIDKPFIPVNELAVPYKLDHLEPSVAVRVLHGSTAVNLLQAYNGINLDLAGLALQPDAFTKHFFLTDAEIAAAATTTGNVVDGDSLLVLIPQ